MDLQVEQLVSHSNAAPVNQMMVRGLSYSLRLSEDEPLCRVFSSSIYFSFSFYLFFIVVSVCILFFLFFISVLFFSFCYNFSFCFTCLIAFCFESATLIHKTCTVLATNKAVSNCDAYFYSIITSQKQILFNAIMAPLCQQ